MEVSKALRQRKASVMVSFRRGIYVPIYKCEIDSETLETNIVLFKCKLEGDDKFQGSWELYIHTHLHTHVHTHTHTHTHTPRSVTNTDLLYITGISTQNASIRSMETEAEINV